MKGQVTLEFLLLYASLLAIYAVVLSVAIPQFNKANTAFNEMTVNNIAEQIAWKANEVNLLNDGSIFYANFSTPFETTFSVSSNQITTNSSNASFAIRARDREITLRKGVNELIFEKTSESVEIQLK